MPLETEKPDMMPEDLNPNWPTGTDGIKYGDNHIRILKIVTKNVWQDLKTYKAKIASDFAKLFDGDKAKKAIRADVATNAEKLGDTAANLFAKASGTYANLRAQATTKEDVGLGDVQNHGISDSLTLNSSNSYASSKAIFDLSNRPTSAPTTLNAIGSYSIGKRRGISGVGTVIAGSTLYRSGINGQSGGGRMPGGWRAMSEPAAVGGGVQACLFVRVY